MLHLFPQMANTAQENGAPAPRKPLVLDSQSSQPSQAHLAVRALGRESLAKRASPWKGITQSRAETVCCSHSVAAETSLRAEGSDTRSQSGWELVLRVSH